MGSAKRKAKVRFISIHFDGKESTEIREVNVYGTRKFWVGTKYKRDVTPTGDDDTEADFEFIYARAIRPTPFSEILSGL
jgi:hypothetical protein